jgi:hypothetical protein
VNASAIVTAAKRIGELDAALAWMRSHGLQALNPADKDAFGVHVSLNSCSGLNGAKEAATQLSGVARHFGLQILQSAITDAENTIEILRQQIEREITSQ